MLSVTNNVRNCWLTWYFELVSTMIDDYHTGRNQETCMLISDLKLPGNTWWCWHLSRHPLKYMAVADNYETGACIQFLWLGGDRSLEEGPLPRGALQRCCMHGNDAGTIQIGQEEPRHPKTHLACITMINFALKQHVMSHCSQHYKETTFALFHKM